MPRLYSFQQWSALLALVVVASLVSAQPTAATCESDAFTTRIGPPAMAQPDGNIQTITRDCSGIAGCSDFFDIHLEGGDALYLSLCSNGGSTNFASEISIWPGYTFSYSNHCDVDNCGTATELTFYASYAQTYRIRIGYAPDDLSAPAPDGNYTLAYSAPAGRVIVPSSCGNGALDAGEECDDGNDVRGDCCSRSCVLEGEGSSCPDDGNDCTDDVCDAGTTCTHPDRAMGETCTDEGIACTDDVCDGAGTCTHPNTPVGQYCDDGEALFCTTDTCDGAGTCTHVEFPGCNMLPACADPQGAAPPAFPHPYKAYKLDVTLVQAFVGCNIPGGSTPNATTETGTVPTCFPAITPNEETGSPASGWLWGPKGCGNVILSARCTGAGDLGIKLRLSGITDGNGALLNGDGTFLMGGRLTLTDPSDGAMTTVDYPLSFGFHVIDGFTKINTSLNAMLLDDALPPLPTGTVVEFNGIDPSGGLFEVRDSNGNTFARPGIWLQ